MLLPAVVGGMVLIERRMTMEVLPQKLRDFWKRWQLRALVLLSITSQMVLIFLGNRRKYNPKTWIKIAVWCAYLLADSVATMALGVLLNNIGDIYEYNGCSLDVNTELTAFWAPFFLLHLGGPDTITAYSLEDNELYLRHAFGLLTQTASAIYIFYLAWSGSHLSFLAIPMILVGCIKYVERTWTLYLASSDKLRDSLLGRPDPGPNYPKFMDEYILKRAEGFIVQTEEVKDDVEIPIPAPGGEQDPTYDAYNIIKAHDLFQTFKCLFADLILSFQDRDYSQSVFEKMSPGEAFNVIAIELGFMYDFLFTKASVIHTSLGLVRRVITTSLTCIVLVIFSFADKQKYHKVDLSITFVLLVVAILLEIYAAFALFLSDQSILWFSKHAKVPILKSITNCLEPVTKLPRWSNSMGQYSITCLCLKEKHGLIHDMARRLHLDKIWEGFRYATYKQVPENLKKLIFKHAMKKCDQFKEKIRRNDNDHREIYTNRGCRAIDKYNMLDSLDWSIKVEFDNSILIWHIATEFCYYSATEGNISSNTNRKMSKFLSRYMMYLLVAYPSLLPVGIGLIRYRDTRSEAVKFFEERMPVFCTREIQSTKTRDRVRERRILACTMLLKVKTNVSPAKVKGDRSKSVLFDASKLASALNEMEDEMKWKMVRDVWLEMLTYAASQGRGSQHARQLKGGGELLTHVWLLMAHFGMTDQFQISQGHARAKLDVK